VWEALSLVVSKSLDPHFPEGVLEMKLTKQNLKWISLLSTASTVAIAFSMPAYASPKDRSNNQENSVEVAESPFVQLANQTVVNDQSLSGARENVVETIVSGSDVLTRITDGPISGAKIATLGNTVAAETSGLTALNELTSDAVSIDGNEISSIDGVASFDSVTLAKGYSTLLSQQIIESDIVAGVIDGTSIVTTSEGDLVDSSLVVEENTVSASASSGVVSNTLTQAADTEMSAGASAALFSKQNVGKYADTLAKIDEVQITASADDAQKAAISLSDNGVLADATALSAENQLRMAAGSIEGSDTSEWGGTARYKDAAITEGFSTLVSEQTVEDQTGAEITDHVTLAIDVGSYDAGEGYDFSTSSTSLDRNTVAANANAANATNSLNQSADTTMVSGASSSLTSRQAILNERGAETFATVNETELSVYLDDDIQGSAASISNNTVQAGASGLTANNTLSVEAGSIEGDKLFKGGYFAIGDLTVAKGTSTLVSDQLIEDDVTASVEHTDIRLTANDDMEAVDGELGSSLKLEQNAVDAAATAGSVRNILNQTSATGMSGANAASLSSAQEITGDTKIASKVEDASLTVDVRDDVKDVASSLSLANNSVQAVTTGLSSGNSMAISAGTEIDGSGAASLAKQNGSSFSTADFSLLNYQSVEAETLTATVDDPQIRVKIGGDLQAASSIDASGNLVRALTTGAVSSNEAALEASVIDGVGIASVNQQFVTADLNAVVEDPEIRVSIGGGVSDQSSVAITSNAIVSAATAASSTNTVSVDGVTSIAGGEGMGAMTLSFDSQRKGYYDATEAGAATLLNEQSSNGAVSSGLTDVGLYLTVEDSVEGALRVEDNTILAQTRGNVAGNVVSIDAGTSIAPSAEVVLASNQSRSGSISARIESGSVTAASGPSSADRYEQNDRSPWSDRAWRGRDDERNQDMNTVDGFVGVKNNLVRASAAANTVLNDMMVNSGTTAGMSSGAALNAGTATGALVSTAQYSVLNSQNNDASVLSDISDFDMSLTGGRLAGAVSLQGNAVLADATGNSAYNTLTISSGIDSYGTASVMNVQTNTSDISASVRGVDMVVRAGAPYQGGSASYSNSGNTIAATAVGNAATTVLSRTR
jgi:hypothetical protein